MKFKIKHIAALNACTLVCLCQPCLPSGTIEWQWQQALSRAGSQWRSVGHLHLSFRVAQSAFHSGNPVNFYRFIIIFEALHLWGPPWNSILITQHALLKLLLLLYILLIAGYCSTNSITQWTTRYCHMIQTLSLRLLSRFGELLMKKRSGITPRWQ